jgi:hypothetical protein
VALWANHHVSYRILALLKFNLGPVIPGKNYIVGAVAVLANAVAPVLPISCSHSPGELPEIFVIS